MKHLEGMRRNPKFGRHTVWGIWMVVAVLCAEGRLFTMYRHGPDDVLVALDAATGATVWEQRDKPVPWPEMDQQFGLGPNSTPLLVGTTVVGIGISGRMRAVTGRLRWQRDLPANPMVHRGMIMTLVGSETTAVVALKREDGSVVWRSAPGGISYAQPTLTTLAGREHFLYFEPEGVVALDLATGKTLWRHPIEFRNGNHLKAQALWADGKLLFLDETGKLALARLSSEKMELLASVEIAKPDAWTLPTLVGTTVFVRDEEKILALDLAPAPPPKVSP